MDKSSFKLDPGVEKRADEIGYKGTMRYVWVVCPNCGQGRWTQRVNLSRANYTGLCNHCNLAHNIRRTLTGKEHPGWKGGRYRSSKGWVYVYLEPGDFFYKMASEENYVAEHRLVMAKHLKRCLLSWEVVHHKNGVKDDNRLENLKLLPSQKHHMSPMLWEREMRRRDKRINELEGRVTLLEAENILLQSQSEGIAHE